MPNEAIAWSIGIARLQLSNAERAKRRQDRLVQRILTVDPPSEAIADEETELIAAFLETLHRMRPAEAEVLRLTFWEELQPKQIATVLGVSVNAATVRLHRAKRRFAVLWSKSDAAAGHVNVKEGSDR